MKRNIWITLGIFVGGGIIIGTIDSFLGYRTENMGVMASMFHKVMYMAWGAAMVFSAQKRH